MVDADRPAEQPAQGYPEVRIAKPAPDVPKAKKSDLGTRIVSAVVMLAAAGLAFWLGGWWWTGFVIVVGMGVLLEWANLVFGFVPTPFRRGLWLAAGLVYVGVAASMLAQLRHEQGDGFMLLPMVLLGVIATDVGAYFAGRAIGGPKIAPKISPSKTWAGLGGGMVLAGLAEIALTTFVERGFDIRMALGVAVFGALTAIVAQVGDFFESWMKRRAGVKDSSDLIPGHGGLFDRLDGLLAVMFALGLFALPITLANAA
ncbi:MAG TPA: phosphatidate cytidylyltransferase [Novosphingobium sp.]